MMAYGAENPASEMRDLLLLARPMMEAKCCHFDWCVEHRGVVTDDQTAGFSDVVDGMHPGCAPYRAWLERYDAGVG